MSYKCLGCDHIFEECEAKKVKEDFGYTYSCPICGGDFEETVKCSICKGEFLEDELNGGVCKECIDEYRNNFDLCDNICANQKAEIKINALIASILDEADIEAILTHYIKTRMSDVDCSQFIDSDIEWFGEQIAKGGKSK